MDRTSLKKVTGRDPQSLPSSPQGALQRSVVRGLLVGLLMATAALPGSAQLVANGEFDSDLSSWTLPAGSGSATWSGDDAEGSGSSGSVILITTAGQGTGDGIEQCITVGAGEPFTATSMYRIPVGQSEPGNYGFVMQFFSAPGCNDPDFLSASGAFNADEGEWLMAMVQDTTPAGTASVKVGPTSRKASGAISGQPYEVQVDQVRFVLAPPGLIFGDGFETGNTTSWSSTTP